MSRTFSPSSRRVRAFSLVEVLVVIAILAVLTGILLIVTTRVSGAAETARAQAQLQSIAQAIQAFETDFNEVPPLVPEFDAAGNVVEGVFTPRLLASATNAETGDVLIANRYQSEYSLTVYLLGIGRFDPIDAPEGDTGVGDTDFRGHDGVIGPGYKAPGATLAWKDPNELRRAGGFGLNDLNGDAHRPRTTGRTYGPYLDIATVSENLDYDPERGLWLIRGPGDVPIRYYRDWPTRDPDEPENPDRSNASRTPFELWNAEMFRTFSLGGADQIALDNPELYASDPELLSADYALLAAPEAIDELLELDSWVELNEDGELDLSTLPDASIGSETGEDAVERFIEEAERFTR